MLICIDTERSIRSLYKGFLSFESIENKTEMDEAMLLCYRGLLSTLEESKADVVRNDYYNKKTYDNVSM